MNKAFKTNWHWFLIGAIITSVIVCSGISIKCKPNKEEKILYYICSRKVDISNLVKKTKKACSEEIREVRINSESYTESTGSRLFGLVYDSTDIYIYPEEQLYRTVPLSIHFTEEEINNLIPNSVGKELYKDKDEEKFSAIKIYNKETKKGLLNGLVDYYLNDNLDQNYYLSFFKSSIHINGLNESYSDNAIKTVNHLLGL